MLSKSYIPFQHIDNFYGVNAKDTPENMLPGEWSEHSIDIWSDPRGAVGSRPGFSALTTASIGSATAWCGFYQFRTSAKTNYYIGGAEDGKLYRYHSNKYEELYSGLASEDDDDRFCFAQLDDICVITDGVNAPLKYTGSGSAASLGGTIVTADFCVEWQKYMWLHSTVDPRLMYYCTTISDPESGFTSFLNFDDDSYEIIGACKQGDDLIVGKQWSLFRVQYLGTDPLFKKYRIPSNVGPVSHYTMKQTPDGRLIFAAPDYNVYMLIGDTLVSVGDNIKKFLKNGVNARLQYMVSGMLYNENQYWLAGTYKSTSTTNDRTYVMDYSRPYQDKWGKLQYPWFVYSIAANCFAETYISGKAYLYHGGYVGKMYNSSTGTNDDSSAFTPTYKSKIFSHGDTTLEKKYSSFSLLYERKGSHNLHISFVCDDNANTQKNIVQAMSAGIGYNSLWDNAYWGEDYWSSTDDADIGRHIDRTGKLIQITMLTDGVDEAWNVYSYNILTKPLRRGTIRVRETS